MEQQKKQYTVVYPGENGKNETETVLADFYIIDDGILYFVNGNAFEMVKEQALCQAHTIFSWWKKVTSF